MSSSEAAETTTVGQMYGGLVFLKTQNRPRLVDFYCNRLDFKKWLEQPDITIVSHGNLLLGLHQTANDSDAAPDVDGMYTLVYPMRQQVDTMYQKLKDVADGPPRVNERYRIYQFFATDVEGRKLECQAFLHDVCVVSSDPEQGGTDPSPS